MEFDYSQFGLSTEELFSHVDNNDLASEKITAPRYSYWKSVFRVFFRNKLNIVILALLPVSRLYGLRPVRQPAQRGRQAPNPCRCL